MNSVARPGLAYRSVGSAPRGLAGNVLLDAAVTGLPKDSVAVPLGLEPVDRARLVEPAGQLPRALVDAIDDGLRAVLGL